MINRKLVETPVRMMNRMEEITDLICEYNEEVQKQQQEIERLNNIINELEKELEERYLDFKDSECEEVRTTAYEDISILQKIKELKGVDKE